MIVAILILTAPPINAQQTGPVSSRYPQLQEYLQVAVENNPELRALWHQYQAELEQIPQVGTLPDPEIRVGYTLNPMMSDQFLGRFSASAMQMFPWFGTLKSRRNMQQAAAQVDYEQLNSRQREILRDIQLTWFDLAELHRKIEITDEIIRLVRDLESLVEIRYETGQAGQADLLRIQMEEQRLRTQIENLQDKENPLKARFNAFLNREIGTDVETAKPELQQINLNEQQLTENLREFNSDFAALDAREEMLQESRNLARLDGRPSFGIGIEVMGRDYSAMSMFPDSREMFMVMATIRVPLYRARYSAQHRQATERLQAVDFQRNQTEKRLMTELQQSLEQFRESDRSIRLLDQELIPRAEQALEILREEYGAGNTRFDEVLQIQRQLLDLEMERIETITNQQQSLVTIEFISGSVIPYTSEK